MQEVTAAVRFLAAAVHWLHRRIEAGGPQNLLGLAGPQMLAAKYQNSEVWF
jgi:hypothetical protein